MPDRISVRSFLDEAREDVSSPTTSNFMSTMNACRNTVGALEEVRLSPTIFIFVCVDFYLFVNENACYQGRSAVFVGGSANDR